MSSPEPCLRVSCGFFLHPTSWKCGRIQCGPHLADNALRHGLDGLVFLLSSSRAVAGTQFLCDRCSVPHEHRHLDRGTRHTHGGPWPISWRQLVIRFSARHDVPVRAAITDIPVMRPFRVYIGRGVPACSLVKSERANPNHQKMEVAGTLLEPFSCSHQRAR